MKQSETWKEVWNSGRARGGEFTVFVDNLPLRLDCYGLKGIFKKAGKISDAYIPFRLGRQSKRRFGFVRFWRKEDARKSILMFNNYSIRGSRIKVSEAKYEKRVHPRAREGNAAKTSSRVNNSNQKGRVVVMSQSGKEDIKIITEVQGDVCEETESWLKCSLICDSDGPRDPSSLANAVHYEVPPCLKVTDMGLFKFALTFESLEKARAAMEDYKEVLSIWFRNIIPWEETEVCETRRLWVEIYGIPGHAWSKENIQKIVNCWGELVCTDSSTEQITSFSMARALIDTTSMKPVGGQVLFIVRGKGYRIFVQEARASVWPYNPSNNVGQYGVSSKKPFMSEYETEAAGEKEQLSSSMHIEVEDQLEDGNRVQDSQDNHNLTGLNLNSGKEADEQSRDEDHLESCSRTITSPMEGKSNKRRRLVEAFNAATEADESQDSEDSFVAAARHAWEVSKAVGLATKRQDEEVVEIIARNLAEEAEQRKADGHQ